MVLYGAELGTIDDNCEGRVLGALLGLMLGTESYDVELGIINGTYEGRVLGFVLGALLGLMLGTMYSAELAIILKI